MCVFLSFFFFLHALASPHPPTNPAPLCMSYTFKLDPCQNLFTCLEKKRHMFKSVKLLRGKLGWCDSLSLFNSPSFRPAFHRGFPAALETNAAAASPRLLPQNKWRWLWNKALFRSRLRHKNATFCLYTCNRRRCCRLPASQWKFFFKKNQTPVSPRALKRFPSHVSKF